MDKYPLQFTAQDRTPYTYCLTNKQAGIHYYGSRTAKGCDPHDLWSTYFTSSRIIRELIVTHGKDSFTYRTMRVFNSADECLRHETMFLLRVGAANNPRFYNRHNGGMNFSRAGKPGTFRGLHHSPESKEKMAAKRIGISYGKQSPETCKKKSERMSGERNPMYGKHLTDEQKIKTKLYGEKNGMYGRKHNESAREKMRIRAKNRGPITEENRHNRSLAHRGKKMPQAYIEKRRNEVWIRNEDTGHQTRVQKEFLEEYASKGYSVGTFKKGANKSKRICASCGAENKIRLMFCSECGTALQLL